MARDVVICFFSAPPKSAPWYAIAQPLDLFAEPPLVVSWGPGAGWSTINQYRGTDGRLLPGLLKALGIAADGVRRLGMISFSAGRQAAQRVLEHAEDRAQLDFVMDLDGLHADLSSAGQQANIKPWRLYAESCFDASRLMVMCHTQIEPGTFTSTHKMNRLLFDAIAASAAGVSLQQQTWYQQELERLPPPPATITNQGVTRTWQTFPQLDGEVFGNAFRWGMPGNQGVDHVFAAGYLQGAMWRAFIVPRWTGASTTTFVNPEKLRVNPGSGGSPPENRPTHPAPDAPGEPPQSALQEAAEIVLPAVGGALLLEVLFGLFGFLGPGLISGGLRE